jgi:hypothetical protein
MQDNISKIRYSILGTIYAPGLALHKGKELESTMLHEVVPQAPLQWLSSWRKTFTATVPICDDNLINGHRQDLDLNYSIQEILISFIFFLDIA